MSVDLTWVDLLSWLHSGCRPVEFVVNRTTSFFRVNRVVSLWNVVRHHMLIAGDVVTIDSALVFVIICETRVCVVVGETVVQAVSHRHPVGVFVRQLSQQHIHGLGTGVYAYPFVSFEIWRVLSGGLCYWSLTAVDFRLWISSVCNARLAVLRIASDWLPELIPALHDVNSGCFFKHVLFLINCAHFTHIIAAFYFILLARYNPNTKAYW